MADKNELCPDCQKTNQECFQTKADDVAKKVPELANPALSVCDICRAHCEIVRIRKEAQNDGCLKSRNINPDYPGRDIFFRPQ